MPGLWELTGLERGILGCLYVIAGIFGTTGNLLTLVTWGRGLQELGCRAWLHMNFALSNILIVVVFFFPASSAFAGRWLYGEVACQSYGFEGMIAGMGQIGALTALAWGQANVDADADSRKRSILFGWLFASVWAIGPLIGWSSYGIEAGGVSCTFNWQVVNVSYVTYAVMIWAFGFVIPYFLSINWVKSTACIPKQKLDPKDWSNYPEINTVIGWCIFVSIIAWIPYGLAAAWPLFASIETVPKIVGVYAPVSAKLGTCFYPWIHIWHSARFRQTVSSLLFGTTSSASTAEKEN
ncbi:visual pigment-like receptor peropsin [Lingula anatina]|uniref:Visual pigment-like receptor peropsin n=1 Tax=Lingula anatina TaxID=7574 RepID=A0A1S3JA52_LINAN|nr:visual pigment-like receptor peropsin [Lingula anatina]|eukprot:XP_013406759.1 visual pigment-like receptor peropsin [Lingula anatina]